MKYTPSWTENDEPVAVEPLGIVVAKGLPAVIAEFPNNPDTIVWLQEISSPSKNVCVELSWVFDER